jgi:imidazolonepropionase
MAQAGTVAVMLPGAYYFLRDTKVPPIERMRALGIPMALASDHNPGSSPGLSLLLMLNMACTLFRMTPEEAVRGVTVNAARALGLRDRGQLAAGLRADFCVWNLDHPNELAYWFGRNACQRVIIAGEENTL